MLLRAEWCPPQNVYAESQCGCVETGPVKRELSLKRSSGWSSDLMGIVPLVTFKGRDRELTPAIYCASALYLDRSFLIDPTLSATTVHFL